MELYEMTFHFPNTFGSLNHEELTLKSVEYYRSTEDAIARAKTIAYAFVVPCPDFWYMECNGKVWTEKEDVDAVKRILHYDLLTEKPQIIEV